MFYKRINITISTKNYPHKYRVTITAKQENGKIIHHQTNIDDKYFKNEDILEYINIIAVLKILISKDIRVDEVYFYLDSFSVISQLNCKVQIKDIRIKHLISIISFLQKQLDTQLFFNHKSHKQSRIDRIIAGIGSLLIIPFVFSLNAQAEPDFYKNIPSVGTKNIVLNMPILNPYYIVNSDSTVIIPIFNGVWSVKKERSSSVSIKRKILKK